VTGASVTDTISGLSFDVTAHVTLVAATEGISTGPRALLEQLPVALAMNLVVGRRPAGPAAFGVRFVPLRPDPAGVGARYLFVVPWRDSTMIGTFYRRTNLVEARERPTPDDLASVIEECQHALPSLSIDASEVRVLHRGILPLAQNGVLLADRAEVAPLGNTQSLRAIRMAGVKYTTARAVAERAVDLALNMLGRRAACGTADTPLDHGTFPADSGAAHRIPSRGAILHAIRDEMALRLGDVVLRRTPMGVIGCPPREDLEAVTGVMAEELGWNSARRDEEIERVQASYAPCALGEAAAVPRPGHATHG
jgi:glycerol-3-phosphate dehydrogenase